MQRGRPAAALSWLRRHRALDENRDPFYRSRTMTHDAITLRGMRFHTLVGLLPHEEHIPQPLELDVTVFLSLRKVGLTDSPKALLDYRHLYRLVAESVGTSPHRLLEGLCELIASKALALENVDRVRVAARKPHAPIPGPLESVEVVIERAREGAGPTV